jgi:hypothetical protein
MVKCLCHLHNMFFSSQELLTSRSETSIIVQGPETKRYGYKTLICIHYPICEYIEACHILEYACIQECQVIYFVYCLLK